MNLVSVKDELEEIGFVVIKDLIPLDTAGQMARRVMELKKEEDQGYSSGDTIFNALDPSEYEFFLPLINNPVIQELAEHMLGPRYKICGDIGRLWSKPGDPAQGLHADLPVGRWYIERNNRPVEYCPTLQVIWTLTDFTKENGATEILPFSHFSQRSPRKFDYDRYVVSVEAPAGGAIVMHGSAWHRRGFNRTEDQHRVGVSVPHIAQWLDPVSVGWRQINQEVREQLPKEVQHLFPHVEEKSL